MDFRSSFLFVLTFIHFLVPTAWSYAITGIGAGVQGSGERPFRTEISSFASAGPAFDLYILALQAIHQADESELLSFFQISGIHGYPVIEWDGAPGNPSWGWGYCTHDSVLFPAWHRSYVALYEQVLWQNAQTIATTYPSDQRDEYVNAALTFRVPYWDWALNPSIPQVATMPTINVNTPTGYHAIDNPLFNYTFHSRPIGNGFPDSDPPNSPPFSTYMSTVRWPDSNGTSRNDLATQACEQLQSFLLSTVYELLSSTPNYTQFSTDAVSQTSVEYVHNVVHYLVGGIQGHMDWLQWAAFDPMFWLHHANVDRVFAMWQAMNPDSWIQPFTNPGTYSIAAGTTVNGGTPLSPFHIDSAGDFYTADSVRWDKWFGYTYPEVIDWNTNATAFAAAVRAEVNKLYNPGAGTSSKSRRSRSRVGESQSVHSGSDGTMDHLSNDAKRDVTADLIHTVFGQSISSDVYHALNTPNLPTQWVINIRVSKHALPDPQPFNIDLFFGSPSGTHKASRSASAGSDSTESLSANVIGTFPVLSSHLARSDNPATGRSGSELYNFATIPLTSHLALAESHGLIKSLESDEVLPFLKRWLTAQVRMHPESSPDSSSRSKRLDQPRQRNHIKSLNNLNGFSLQLLSRQVKAPLSQDEFPEYSEWREWKDVQPHFVAHQ